MANILTAVEAANVLRCLTTDALMLQLLPQVDKYIYTATGRNWTLDSTIEPTAKSAAQMLLVMWHEAPGQIGQGITSLPWGLSAALVQLEALALQLETSGVPDEALKLQTSMPVDGAIGVAIGANLTLVFNHEMDSSATSAVILKTAAGATVTTVNSLDVTKKILTVNPSASLTADARYTLEIVDAPDIYGQTLEQDIGFETA